MARLADPIKAAEQGHEHARANARVVMNPLARKSRLVATDDWSDRAHNTHDHRGMLVSARDVRHATPREYDASYIIRHNGRRYSIETAADDLHAARLRLEGIPGIGIESDGNDVATRTRMILARHSRDSLRPRTRTSR
ncbi:MAG: hypothetical protein AB7I13_00460 [Vicinamibacterales bacterium]